VTASHHRPGGSGEVRAAPAAAPGSVRTREGAALADAPGADSPPSLKEFTGHPAYGLDQLRGDLERFVFLLGGSDGEPLFGP
jgi:hypothetical protein